MTFSEIYNFFIIWKDKIDYQKTIMYTPNNLIIIIDSVK
jgi:hypothetical protein